MSFDLYAGNLVDMSDLQKKVREKIRGTCVPGIGDRLTEVEIDLDIGEVKAKFGGNANPFHVEYYNLSLKRVEEGFIVTLKLRQCLAYSYSFLMTAPKA